MKAQKKKLLIKPIFIVESEEKKINKNPENL